MGAGADFTGPENLAARRGQRCEQAVLEVSQRRSHEQVQEQAGRWRSGRCVQDVNGIHIVYCGGVRVEAKAFWHNRTCSWRLPRQARNHTDQRCFGSGVAVPCLAHWPGPVPANERGRNTKPSKWPQTLRESARMPHVQPIDLFTSTTGRLPGLQQCRSTIIQSDRPGGELTPQFSGVQIRLLRSWKNPSVLIRKSRHGSRAGASAKCGE